MDLPSELRSLIVLCRHDLGIHGDDALDAGLDVAAFVRLVEAHRLSVVAARSWSALAACALAPPVPAALANSAARSRQRSLFASAHLARLAAAFDASGIAWRALKGPALSLQLHGDATVRTVRDLDIIVPKPQVATAVAAAASVGWNAAGRWRELLEVTGRYEMELSPTLAGQPLLELHRALGPRHVQFRLDPFAPDATCSVVISDVEIPTLTGDAQATYVAWHGARGLWYRLSWLMDLARLLPRDEASARRLIASAGRWQAESAVRAGALFAHRLLGTALPPWPAASSAMCARVEAMLRWSFERLSLGVDAPSVWTPPGSHRWLWREVAQQQDRWRAAAGALEQLTRPTARDAEQLGIGLPIAAHRLARPFFIARRWLRSSSPASLR